MADGVLTSIAVEIRFRGDADGETRLTLPNRWAGETDYWKHLRDLSVEGATARVFYFAAPGGSGGTSYSLRARAMPISPDGLPQAARPSRQRRLCRMDEGRRSFISKARSYWETKRNSPMPPLASAMPSSS